ncbi:MAG: family 20 glycosylhydrolase [Kiritimatiellaeota bacterium]|nr:family 20 glycosylhydrolase [Kiritimatiellota bacterium]
MRPFPDTFPVPRRVTQRPGQYTLAERPEILVAGDYAMTVPASRYLEKSLRATIRRSAAPGPVYFRIADCSAPEQSYRMRIAPGGIVAQAHDSAGLFYAAVTLVRIVTASEGGALPCCDIEDWPDFPTRGVMLDISRDKVPTMETLLWLIDRLAEMKFNHLQLYTEHTFAYAKHSDVWKDASPLTPAEVRALDAHCAERCIELAPNQNSLGHMERWLKLPQYAHLAELPQGGAPLPWGGVWERPTTLCPTDPRTFDFLNGLYDELLPNFTSRLFNVGCDEPFDLRGNGRSREAIEQKGEGRVYLDFLLRLHEMTAARGFRMAFWGDIINNHPELIPEVPKDALALEWGYEADHPFDAHGARFAAAGIPFWVCPGTSSWNSLGGRTGNMFANILSAAENGLKHRAAGLLVCDWGDGGHWHPLGLSFPGFTVAAGLSWCLETNRAAPWHEISDIHLTGGMGAEISALGKMYLLTGALHANSTELYHIFTKPMTRPVAQGVTVEALEDSLKVLAYIEESIPGTGSILELETQYAFSMMHTAIAKGLLLLGDETRCDPDLLRDLRIAMDALIERFPDIWRLRNREGGMLDSLARMTRIRDGMK